MSTFHYVTLVAQWGWIVERIISKIHADILFTIFKVSAEVFILFCFVLIYVRMSMELLV